MKIEIIKLGNHTGIRWTTMISNVDKLLNNKENFSTMKKVIRIDMIFREYILKDWFRINVNTKKHRKYYEEIAKLCVQCY